MRIAMVASEAAPFVKTGGLGDVMQALPNALSKLKGNEICQSAGLTTTAAAAATMRAAAWKRNPRMRRRKPSGRRKLPTRNNRLRMRPVFPFQAV